MAAINSDLSVIGYTFEDIQAMASEVLKHSTLRPKIGIICGTGLDGIAEAVENQTVVSYDSIPGFPVSTVKGHSGHFVFGTLQGKAVLLMRGRLHYYEGYPMWKVAMPVRVMKAVGIETLLVTNAAGGLNPDYKTGDLMVIKDHIDLPGLTGECVLIGKNDERFGPRFLATNGTYDKDLRQKFMEVVAEMGHADIIKEGVYIMIGGPTFSSTAEVRVLRMFGADAVGMSTVPEAVVGRHSSMRVFGVSLITDMVDFEDGSQFQVTHDDVLKVAHQRAQLMKKMFLKFVQFID
ncbi:purine nucleoside phosphorylase [Aplysia californica]|uniref:Purine nucleoside phosphorylase n=1 Tax=Aplysia californica TaxID=6500 RepID=A0ABM1A7I4_APLCA|nr:purine nucleoside phosphorylase [Aplysia californica]XP_012942348.1 purine nucleoside phosphorylase [Aplysia californica]XP_035827732.1 purine nucleoside phosphorylase [Aplysia californica]XP_035827733.1 purine nucleoside phosphorylase [Aplysia californica]